jgi:hypothetical protein
MKITFDPAKRAFTLAERGLDFEDAAEVFFRRHARFSRRSTGLWRTADTDGGASSWAHVDRSLDTAWKRAACHFDEESKCPRKSALWEAI